MREIELWKVMYKGRKDERPLEYRFVWDNMHLPLKSRRRVLDVGCCDSKICEVLSTLDYEVTGMDIRDYKAVMKTDPTFTFIKEDVRFTKLADGSFDQIICISTLEHIGFRAYGNVVYDEHGDKRAIEKMGCLLRPKGKLLMTVPVGNHKTDYWVRYYSKQALLDLISKFKIENQRYYRKITHVKPHSWISCTIDEATIMGVEDGGLPKAIGCFVLEKVD